MPLIRNLFAFEKSHRRRIDGAGLFILGQEGAQVTLGDLNLESVSFDPGIAPFELSLTVASLRNRLRCNLQYATTLFKSSTMKRFVDRWLLIIRRGLADPHANLSELGALTDSEQRQISDLWNRTRVDRDLLPVPDKIFLTARAAKERVAILHGDRLLRYDELLGRVTCIANALIDRGAVGQIIGLSATPGIERVIAQVAILRAGNAFLPIDPDWPVQRQKELLERAGARLWIVTKPADGLDVTAKSVQLDDLEISGDPLSPFRRSKVDLNSPAYVMFTSGSTGTPKGAIIGHRALANRLAWMQDTYKLSVDDCVLAKTPFSFDVSVWEILWPLSEGAIVSIISPEDAIQGDRLRTSFRRHRVSVAHFVPSLLRRALDAGAFETTLSLRLVIASGEPLTRRLIKSFHRLPWSSPTVPRLDNLYGPTEAAIDVSFHQCLWNARGPVVIGRPIDNVCLYILDAGGQLLPIGVPGELTISGISLAFGYVADPRRTSESFAPDPFSRDPGERQYRTGDQAKWMPDGQIQLLGRLDEQLKILGTRVEPGEIESVLCDAPGVSEAAVVFDKSIGLIAFYSSETILDQSHLRQHVVERLPLAMVPAAYEALEDLPRTASGKINRSSLKRRATRFHNPLQVFRSPVGATEEILAAIWCSVLGLNRVGRDDHFFRLGGDSIHGLNVAVAAKKRGFSLDLMDIFRFPNLKDLARVADLSSVELAKPETPGTRFDHGEIEEILPLGSLQKAFIFHSQYSTDYEVYILGLRVRCVFSQPELERAMDWLSQRHPMLRTSFQVGADRDAELYIYRSAPMPLRVDDLRKLEPEEQYRRTMAWVEEERSCIFDWSRPPLLRWQIFRIDDRHFQLYLSQSCLDGWSVAVTLVDFFRAYTGLIYSGSLPSNPSPRSHYRDFVSRELSAVKSQEQEAFWRSYLKGAAPCELPKRSDSSSAERKDHSEVGRLHRRLTLELPLRLSGNLENLAVKLSVPLKSVLLAAHVTIMSAWIGKKDVLTGVICHGRPTEQDADQAVGLYLNTLAFRITLAQASWKELISEVFRLEKDLLAYRWYPIARLTGRNGTAPAFDSVFNFTHFHIYQSLSNLRNVDILEASIPADLTYFLLTTYFNLHPQTRSITLSLDYDSSRFKNEWSRSIADAYIRILSCIVCSPDSRLDGMAVLSHEEMDVRLNLWNQMESIRPDSLSILERFEDVVCDKPYKCAVVLDGSEFVSYTDLNRRSRALASGLLAWGIRQGDRIGIDLPLSSDWLIVLLGLARIGAAFVPLHPEEPTERKALIIEDSEIVGILSQLSRVSERHTNLMHLSLDSLENTGYKESLEHYGDRAGCREDFLSYVIYTSGSTGKPKGVAVGQRALSSFLFSIESRLPLDSTDVWLAVTHPSFDIGIMELLLPLTTGGTVAFVEPAAAKEPEGLAEALRTSKATVLQSTPSRWWLLTQAEDPPLQSLKAFCGGESLPESLACYLMDAGAQLWNLYGPTEATIWALVGPVMNVDSRPQLGHPLAGVQSFVVSNSLELCPDGVLGEVALAGDTLAFGYAKQPGTTAEVFIPHPFSSQAGFRLYLTGDLGRYSENGCIELIGRRDSQVKLRGFRVELGEIEAALNRLPGVRESVTIVRRSEEDPGQSILEAYLVLALNLERCPERELRQALSKQLPDYMIPARFQIVQSLPQTKNGKIDFQRLARTEVVQDDLGAESPTDPLEEKLLRAWEEILGRFVPSVNLSFFDLGGNSLDLVRLQTVLQERFDLEVRIVDFFRFPTIRSFIDSRKPSDQESARVTDGTRIRARRRLAGTVALYKRRQSLIDKG